MEKQTLKVYNVEVQEGKATLEFLNAEQTEVFEMNIYRKQYNKDTEEWDDDEKVSESFYKTIQDGFGVMTENDLEGLIGSEFELFVNPEKGAAYVEEPKSLDILKPTLDEVGALENGKIVDVVDFDTKRMIIVETPKGRRAINFNFGKKNDKLEKYLLSRADLKRKKDKFKDLTGTDWDDFESIIGRDAVVEIRSFKSGTTKIPFNEMKKLQ